VSPVNERNLKIAEIAVLKTPDWKPPTATKGQIVQMFFNVNAAKAHKGLHLLAAEYDINLDNLEPGQYVCFLNRKRNKVKMFSAGNLFAYLSLPDSATVTMETIAQIPQMFLSRAELNFAPTLEAALESPLAITAAAPEAAELATELKRGPGRPRREVIINEQAETRLEPQPGSIIIRRKRQ